jgi:hypothetical protein
MDLIPFAVTALISFTAGYGWRAFTKRTRRREGWLR